MEGQRLGDRYKLEAKIGGGGMAIVYKATDLALNRVVAVKLLRPQFGSDEDFVHRFRREAQAVASLSHPNIVSVYDVGQEDDTYYMVMEYIEGSTLKDLINRQGVLPTTEAVRIAVQVCDALDHAHQNHIIHRDIKPHNILIGKNGRVKVTDFGIARAATSVTITQTGSVLGSVHYFSPEQARGGVSAEKSDIYSLGIVLYEMVTGKLPFSGESPISVALAHLQEPLREPRTVNPRIPQSLENVILRALVKDPFLRYESARGMLLDLETCLTDERQNEPKVSFAIDDEQTRVVPAITKEMLEQSRHDRTQAPLSRATSRRAEREDEEPAKSPWWKKFFLWSGLTVLFVVLAFVGFNFAMKAFYVPEIPVPLVEGTQQAVAEMKLKEAKLTAIIVEQYNNQEKGIVFKQDPAPPMRVKENASVTLYVSKGKQEIAMPSLMNLPQQAAIDLLVADQFTYKIIEKEDEKAPAGQVITQDPLPNTMVIPTEQVVILEVSMGKRKVKVPNVVGKGALQAELELLNHELMKGDIMEEASYDVREAGVVLKTSPQAGESAEVGSKVILTVSNGQYPADAKLGSYPIQIELAEGEQAEIRLLLSDVRGDNQLVVEETINERKKYDVEVILSPKKNGKIQVYKNGELIQTEQINYRTFP